VGVQWHPEDTVASGAGWDRMLFDSFGAISGASR
jgi:gamma-glutamyl-gamma-aminobutyrate hydrolase PuuD